jgi:tRNA G26 N,N-dimethylase Trm1
MKSENKTIRERVEEGIFKLYQGEITDEEFIAEIENIVEDREQLTRKECEEGFQKTLDDCNIELQKARADERNKIFEKIEKLNTNGYGASIKISLKDWENLKKGKG